MIRAARSVVVGEGVLRAAKAGELAAVAGRRVEEGRAAWDPTASQAVCHGIQTAKHEPRPLTQIRWQCKSEPHVNAMQGKAFSSQ